jgi:hypothetical protein
MLALLLCAWCGKQIGETQTYNGEPSHGICKPCLAKMMGEMETNDESGSSDVPQTAPTRRE